jgi:head-tail adaptor
MRAGNLKHKVIIQSIGSTVNDFGEIEVGDFQTFKTVYCSINPVVARKSDEIYASNTDFTKAMYKIRIRYIDGVNASMRILWGIRVFNIVSLSNTMEARKEIEILAEEAING